MQKKQALIDAAIKLFARNGFDATRTASIGMYAGVTEPLIHYHFKNKDGYMTNCLEAGIKSGEFKTVPVVATTGILLSIINGLLKRRSLQLDHIDGLLEATVEFCRRSLI